MAISRKTQKDVGNYEAKLINCKKIIASNNSELFNLSKNNVLFLTK